MNETMNKKTLKICMQYMKNYDENLYLHSIRVTRIACRMLRILSMEGDICFLEPAAMLHDIGKLLIPEKILYKPGRLTANERSIINEHSYLGYKLLSCLNVPDPIKHIVLLHHGAKASKYVDYETIAFTKEESHMAQLLQAADAYEALTSDRVYHKRMSGPDALYLMENEKMFHPDCLAALRIFTEHRKEVYT